MFGSAVGAGPLSDRKVFSGAVLGPTSRTQLARGEERVYLDDGAPIPERFILEHSHKAAPRRIRNTFSQPPIFNHCFWAQGFQANQAVLSDECGRGFVQKVLSGVSNPGVYLRKLGFCFAAVIAARLLSRKIAPCTFKFALEGSVRAWVRHSLTVARGEEVFEAEVYTHDFARGGQGKNAHLAQNRSKVFSRTRARHGDVQNPTLNLPALVEFDPLEFGKFQLILDNLDIAVGQIRAVGLLGTVLLFEQRRFEVSLFCRLLLGQSGTVLG